MSTPKIIQKILKQTPDSELIERALEFAKEAHLNQKRSSGDDYIQHPIRVAQILKEMHLDPKAIAAGLLHDVPDDTKKTLGDIEKEFGKDVAFLVAGVSKLGKLRYPKSGLEVKPVEERIEEPIDSKAENLRKMFFAMAQDLRVILIKLADRLNNMETLGSLPPEKQKRIALETLEIFAPLANRLGMGEMKGRLEDLSFPYLYPKEYEWLMKNVKERYEKRKKYIEKVKPILVKILDKEKIKPIDVHSRAKHYWSLHQKLLKHEMNFDKIHDLVALRVIVDEVKTCYEILGIIHKFWRPLPGRIKDYIAFPKPNGYQALHTTLFCLDGKITEIQVKTREMHEEAEYGIAAHWAAKEKIDLKTQGKRFAWVAQLSDWQKGIASPKEYLEGLKIDFFKNRIFIFTPKGDVIDLPEGATPVDFAYAVHTDIGAYCSGAKINGKIGNISQSLQNGDVVEILVDKKRGPSRDWLEFVKTSFARSRIRRTLKIEKGKISPKEVIKNLIQPQHHRVEKTDSGGKAEISLAGERGIQICLAKCCLPKPSQKIKAYITKGRGASVHKIDCQNLIKAQKKWPQKIIEASWLSEKKLLYPVFLNIQAQDRIGLLRDVSSTISKLGINVLSYKSELQPPGKPVIINIQVEVSGLEELDRLFNQLKEVRGILELKKN